MKARVRRYVRYHESAYRGVPRDVDDREAGRLATDHYVQCSCALCGNRRRHFGPKHSELVMLARHDPLD